MTGRAVKILGGKGMLGTDLAEVSRKFGFEPDVFDLPEFDITSKEQLQRVVTDGSMMVNCAAYTNVEKAESEPDIAYKVNAEAAGLLGETAKAAGARVVHISTDFVFDGKLDRPYTETDTPNPLSAYGKSKLAGERLLAESGCDFCIIRVQWTYGKSGNNFVKKMIESTKIRNELKVVDDQVGCPTWTFEVSRAVCEMLKQSDFPAGIFHYSAAGFVSRYGMAKFIFDKLSIDVKVQSCKTSDFPSAAKRPLNSRFNCDKIQRLLPSPIKGWQEQLDNFLEQL